MGFWLGWPLQEGHVLLDGVTLPAMDHAWLHKQVAIVSQEPVLFAESLFYNIAFGAEKGEASVSLAQVGCHFSHQQSLGSWGSA